MPKALSDFILHAIPDWLAGEWEWEDLADVPASGESCNPPMWPRLAEHGILAIPKDS